jgi:hypothetical protein
MNVNEISNTITLVKNFIDNSDNDILFDDIIFQLFNLHYKNNRAYYNFCGTEYPNCWEDVPLLPVSLLYKETEDYLGIHVDTQMPFPGIQLISENQKISHFVRDTELYKSAIAKSFQYNILKEMSWVPWINFHSMYNQTANYTTPINYTLDYLSEVFHGQRNSVVHKVNNFLKNIIIEKYGEDESITIPTIFLASSDCFLKLVNYDSSSMDLTLPLGSNVAIISESPQNINVALLTKICKMFELTQIMIMLCLPEISTPLYATIKKNQLSSVEKYGGTIEPEYFLSGWMRAKVVYGEEHLSMYDKIAIYDLANAWSCPFVLTDYVGKIGNKGGIVFKEIDCNL